jgi:hypothetical protein
VSVIYSASDQVMVQEHGSLWVLQLEVLADTTVTVVRRGTFQLVAWASEWICGNGWREIGGDSAVERNSARHLPQGKKRMFCFNRSVPLHAAL